MLGHLSYQAIFCCSLGKTNQNWSRSLFICQALCRFLFVMLNISFCFTFCSPPTNSSTILDPHSFLCCALTKLHLSGKVFRKNSRNDCRIRWNKVQVASRFPLEFPFNYTSCVFHFSPTCLADSWSFRHDLNNLPAAHLSWMSKLSLKLMNVSSGSRTT